MARSPRSPSILTTRKSFISAQPGAASGSRATGVTPGRRSSIERLRSAWATRARWRSIRSTQTFCMLAPAAARARSSPAKPRSRQPASSSRPTAARVGSASAPAIHRARRATRASSSVSASPSSSSIRPTLRPSISPPAPASLFRPMAASTGPRAWLLPGTYAPWRWTRLRRPALASCTQASAGLASFSPLTGEGTGM